jgi:2-polyprenyl-3-methyl-5-hydroxy-6-metoxy-1,4-benzoquinol methylase
MGLERVMFEVFYRVGFVPWDGHKIPTRLTDLVEGAGAMPKGRALDIGCGTGDTSIYLARHGWDVTGIDFVKRALRRAQAKTQAAGVNVRYLHADATRLASYGLGQFQLVADNGCLHGLSDEGREAYVRDLTPMVPSGGRLIIAAFPEGKRRGPRGFNAPEIERRFSAGWELLSHGIDPGVSNTESDPIAVYDLRRR